MVVRKLNALPIEAVVRGYLIGSGYKDYKARGSVCGISLPAGLQMADALPEPLFTPASKAPAGQHDENIDFDAMVKSVGRDYADGIRRIALELYDSPPSMPARATSSSPTPSSSSASTRPAI